MRLKRQTEMTPERRKKRQERITWLLAFIVPLSLFWTCMEWRTDEPPLFTIDDDDVDVDMEMMPDLKEDDDMIAAPTPKPKEPEEKAATELNKVDEVETDAQPDLNEIAKFVPLEGDLADLADSLDDEDVPPIAMDFNGSELPERVLEELPEFPGGYSEMVEWLTRNLRYPYIAQRNKQQGEIVAEFYVEKDGSVSGLKVVQPGSPTLNGEALRVMKLMPKWKPATRKGKPVKAMIHVPIVFAI